VLASRPDLLVAIEKSIESPPEEPELENVLSIFDDEPPEYDASYQMIGESLRPPFAFKKNYLETEARSRTVGLAGEESVLAYKKACLEASGRERLAGRIGHVSVEQGDGAGFDIRSFDDAGDDLLIEVKTTRLCKETPFFISSNEVRFSKSNSSRYSLYRVYRFDKPRALHSARQHRHPLPADPNQLPRFLSEFVSVVALGDGRSTNPALPWLVPRRMP